METLFPKQVFAQIPQKENYITPVSVKIRVHTILKGKMLKQKFKYF